MPDRYRRSTCTGARPLPWVKGTRPDLPCSFAAAKEPAEKSVPASGLSDKRRAHTWLAQTLARCDALGFEADSGKPRIKAKTGFPVKHLDRNVGRWRALTGARELWITILPRTARMHPAGSHQDRFPQ